MERYRIHAEAAVYFLTYTVVEWLPAWYLSDGIEPVDVPLTAIAW